MTLAIEILEWAKDKTDLSEIQYENKSGSAPIEVKITFDTSKPSAIVNGQRLSYISSPAIGQLNLDSAKIQTGQHLKTGDIIGEVNNGTGPVPIAATVSGKIIQTIASHGKPVSYGEPVLVLEITEVSRP